MLNETQSAALSEEVLTDFNKPVQQELCIAAVREMEIAKYVLHGKVQVVSSTYNLCQLIPVF